MTANEDVARRSGHKSFGPGVKGLAWKSALSVLVVVAGYWTLTHGVAGVTWREVLPILRAVPISRLFVLAMIWLGGLVIYATVLAAAMPGLGVRRGLLLNLSGSAVANMLPLGGAVATGLNWRMARRWGHSDAAFVSYCVLTNVLDVVTKLLLPLVAVTGLLMMSVHVPGVLWVVAAGGTGAALVLLVVQALVVRPSSGRVVVGGWPAAIRARISDPVRRIRDLLRRRWTRLMPGSAAYVAAQVVLLLFSLRAVGLAPSLVVVLTATAIERLGSLMPLTPAGTGVAEIGAVAWLVASGLDPVGVVAGVLLYRVFLVAMEIPVGGALLGGWAWLHHRQARAYARGLAP